LEFLQLKYFQEVAKYEHFTRASENLHIAQSTLSISISRLEEELGVQLFDRIGKHIKLNRYGKVFLDRVDKVFLQLEVGKKELQDMAENKDQVFSGGVQNIV
jgi:DNA-binding transcriptional LysR family regulator